MQLKKINIKENAIRLGADKCGIASVDRFKDAPAGFKPTDVYGKCKSVIVFLKSMPSEIILAENPVPYSNAASLIYSEVDKIGMELTRHLQKNNIKAVPIPCDTPYLHWDSEELYGRGILSMRHAALNAGLGILGKNTLLINQDFGNMVYIGAVLVDLDLEPDPMVTDFNCPAKCNRCLISCPQKALNGTTVNQKLCRQIAIAKLGRGFDVYVCNKCRKSCPYRSGYGRRPIVH